MNTFTRTVLTIFVFVINLCVVSSRSVKRTVLSDQLIAHYEAKFPLEEFKFTTIDGPIAFGVKLWED
uniref:Uncharacterized protein n=1 Tax=viral metagenome TaxID=1070528 RepID=A0A6C0JR59_9ZZZZ